VLAFWGVALLLIAVPGPDWAFTISAGLCGRSVAPAVVGLVLGYGVVTLVVAAGLGAVVAGSPAILTGLTVVGGAYLMWHGAVTFLRPVTPTPGAEAGPGSTWNTLWSGAGVSGLNPKGLLIFVALLPQFANPHASWPFALQIGVLALAFTLTCAIFYTCLSLFARTILHARPATAHAVTRFSGAAMVIIGAVLVAERLAS
jgi:threonine/homoserine/homoserine lactone efflux protein